MSDIIRLLPDSVANQIAAGEVVQRPASAVKELLENAVDAGSSTIKLVVKEGGKTFLQVIDNGCGMSETDARMSFERHATSKIKQAEDLFNIHTKGFRGEALASIAAIAQVELQTRQQNNELGTLIEIEASEVKKQEMCSCAEGTVFTVKNLFYNVPARRNFLKSDLVEFRHIVDEFQRVALPHAEIAFSLYHNNNEVYRLEKGNLIQRIVALFGKNYNERVAPVDEDTSIVKMTGFIGKPEHAKRTRGEQFFFINKRYIKNGYLHHAVQSAYEEMLPENHFPSYFLMLEVDPKSIDINIHPTKTEVKFEDEKSIYSLLRSAVKRALGKHNLTPTIDFNQDNNLNIPPLAKNGIVKAPVINVDPNYNPFNNAEYKRATASKDSYAAFFDTKNFDYKEPRSSSAENLHSNAESSIQHSLEERLKSKPLESGQKNYQLHHKYIISPIKSGFIVIDQQAAHERILYEKYREALEKQKGSSQQLLFPQQIEFTVQDTELVKELLQEIHALGFDITAFGKQSFIVHGLPTEASYTNAQKMLEEILDNYKQNLTALKLEKRENIARAMARNMSVKAGKELSNEEMCNLIDSLFACEQPYSSPFGKPSLISFTLEELDKRFKN